MTCIEITNITAAIYIEPFFTQPNRTFFFILTSLHICFAFANLETTKSPPREKYLNYKRIPPRGGGFTIGTFRLFWIFRSSENESRWVIWFDCGFTLQQTLKLLHNNDLYSAGHEKKNFKRDTSGFKFLSPWAYLSNTPTNLCMALLNFLLLLLRSLFLCFCTVLLSEVNTIQCYA